MNPYAIPSLITLIVGLMMGGYVLHKDPKSTINRSFTLMLSAGMVTVFGHFMLVSAPNPETALFWSRFTWAGLVFLPPLFIIFFSTLHERGTIFTKNKAAAFSLFFPSFVSTLLILSDLFIKDVEMQFWGYFEITKPIATLFGGWAAILVFLGFGVLISAYRVASALGRKQISLVMTSFFILSIVWLLYWLLANVGVVPYLPYWIPILSTPTWLIMGFAILKYKIFVIPPISRFFIPTPEERVPTKLKHRLTAGRPYLVKENEPKRSAEIFVDQVTHDTPGLWITSRDPEKITRKHRLKKTPILYLTSERVRRGPTIWMKMPNAAVGIVSNYFLSRVREKSVVLLDCLKEIAFINGFDKAMVFLEELRKICWENRSNLIVMIEPEYFTEEQLTSIEKLLT